MATVKTIHVGNTLASGGLTSIQTNAGASVNTLSEGPAVAAATSLHDLTNVDSGGARAANEFIQYDSALEKFTFTAIDSAYVQLRDTPQNFAYGSLTGAWDSATTTSIIDSAYVQLKAPAAYIKGIADSTYVKGFANEAYIDAFVDAALINSRVNILDSATILNIPALWDSADTTGVIDSAYIQLRDTPQNFAYGSLTGAPNVMDSATILAIPTLWDSADTTSLIDSAYVQLKAPAAYIKGIANEAYVDAFVDAALINSRVNILDSATLLAIPALWDSANTISVIDSAYVQLKAPAAYIKGIADSTYVKGFANEAYIDAFVDAALINSRVNILDSANVTAFVDSAYVRLRETPQNFAYSAITSPALFADSSFVTAQINALIGGAPSTLNTLDEIALALNDDDSAYATLVTLIGTKTNYDSANTLGLIDSAYVQLKAPELLISKVLPMRLTLMHL